MPSPGRWRKSPKTDELYVAPGNGGTAGHCAQRRGFDVEDGQSVLAFAREHNIGLVVIGPEAPLVAGVADVLRKEGLAVFGPRCPGCDSRAARRSAIRN